ncbi:MAG: hypothetical protein LUF31_02440, partial [Fusobacterium sp.]|nr:hypothetical protein [Fusobacterium sp.]
KKIKSKQFMKLWLFIDLCYNIFEKPLGVPLKMVVVSRSEYQPSIFGGFYSALEQGKQPIQR